VRALRNLEERGTLAELEPAAIARAQELATSARRGGYGHGGASARVALVPLLGQRLLDAVALDGSTETASARRGASLTSRRRVGTIEKAPITRAFSVAGL
jgi:hypothetical protein